MKKSDIEELLGENTESSFYPGMDKAMIGITERISLEPIIAYDITGLKDHIKEKDLQKWVFIDKKKSRDETEEVLTFNKDALFVDGYDEAIIGIAYNVENKPIVAYDKNKMLEIMVSEGDEFIDALEHYYYNIHGGWLGVGTPIFIQKELI